MAVHAGVVRLYGAEVTEDLLPQGADGKECLDTGSGKKRSAFCSASFSSLISVTPSQLPFPSVSPSFFPSFAATFSIPLARTIELGSVSAIEWLELMANYLPLGCLACVRREVK